jgi:hypothetical protein
MNYDDFTKMGTEVEAEVAAEYRFENGTPFKPQFVDDCSPALQGYLRSMDDPEVFRCETDRLAAGLADWIDELVEAGLMKAGSVA